MENTSPGGRLVAALLLASLAAPAAAQDGPVVPLAIGSTAVSTVTPPVPTPAGTPCVVELFHNVTVEEQTFPDAGTPYTYAPPAGCPGPWRKVVLEVTVNEEAGGYFVDAATAYIRLGGIPAYEGSMSNVPTQMSPLPHQPPWRVERDVTDLTALLEHPHNGRVGLRPEQTIWPDNMGAEQAEMSARLRFYRATAARPAQATPSAVYRVLPEADTVNLPHNIVRAYLDIYNAQPWWFTCVPDADITPGFPVSPLLSNLAPGGATAHGIFPPGEGCGGGSFAEIGVSIDGTPAGVAPVFPLLSSNLNYAFPNAVNAPIQPPQMLDYLPYRVDLTPFAAILNEAGTHTVALSRPVDAYLLVYQDRHRARVTGAVTLNTLAGAPGTPTVTDTFAPSGDTASGVVTTLLDRDFTIRGFVDTSGGRVWARVNQRSHFRNIQALYLDGLVGPDYRTYRQHLWLQSRTRQHSRRVRAGSVLTDSVVTAAYPLELRYEMRGVVDDLGDGPETVPTWTSARVAQHRGLDVAALKAGFAPYTSRLREHFLGSRTRDLVTQTDSGWQSLALYRFTDNRGSCYRAGMTALDGAVATETYGAGCPGGTNAVRWFAHPDGSPDSLGWLH